MVLPPARIRLPGSETWWVAGSGWSAYREALTLQLGARVQVQPQPRYPSAVALLPLARRELASGRWHAPAEAQPLYLRDKVALTVSERLLAKAG
jgi:tRNA threonylcarbamoyladenosine biosynthesis protein TsaB